MDQIWFSRVRTAGGKKINYTYNGNVNFDINGPRVVLTATSSATGVGPFNRQVWTNDNYSTFSAVSIPTLNSNKEISNPLVNDANNSTTLVWYATEDNPFFLNNSYGPIGYSYSTDFSTAVPVSGYGLPDVKFDYATPGGSVTYSSATMVGAAGTAQQTPQFTGVFPFSWTSSNSTLPPIPGVPSSGNIATSNSHRINIDNTTKAISWVRSGYPTGIQVSLGSSVLTGMGKAVYPLDLTFGALPAPNNYTTPAPASGSFPGKQAVIGDIVFFKPGCLTKKADVVITNGGTGATKGGVNTFQGQLYINPPPLNQIATFGVGGTSGSGYTPKTYDNVPLVNFIGGLGSGAKASFVIGLGGEVASVIITDPGTGYASGDILKAPSLPGGSGFTLTVNTVISSGINTFTFIAGQNYTRPYYTNVPFISLTGTGTGATASIYVAPTGEVVDVIIENRGKGYSAGDFLKPSLSPGTGANSQVGTVDPALRNSLPIVLDVQVNAGVVTAINSILCYGAGFTPGTQTVSAVWDTNLEKYSTTAGLRQVTYTVAYTQTTAPQLTLTLSGNYAPIRSITMKEIGDGYYYDGTNWNGVTTKETPWSNTSRTYPVISTFGTVSWSSVSTGLTGQMPLVRTPLGGPMWIMNAGASPFSYGTQPGGSIVSTRNGTASSFFTPNPASELLSATKFSTIQLFPTLDTLGPEYLPLFGMEEWYAPKSGPGGCTIPSTYNRPLGQVPFSNDNGNTWQLVNLPGLSYQPLVPMPITSAGYTPAAGTQSAGRMLYTSVPDFDPFIMLGSVHTTGNGNNMYITAVHSYGTFNTTTPSASDFSYVVKLYHFQPGPDLNNIGTGAVWTPLWTSAPFSGNIFYAADGKGGYFQPAITFLTNANWNTNTPPTEGVLRVNQTGFAGGNINSTTAYIKNYYFNFNSETSVQEIAAPTGLAWTPDGNALTAVNGFYDVINQRYVFVRSMNVTPAWPGYSGLPNTGAFILLGVGQSMFDPTATTTFLTNTELGDSIWAT